MRDPYKAHWSANFWFAVALIALAIQLSYIGRFHQAEDYGLAAYLLRCLFAGWFAIIVRDTIGDWLDLRERDRSRRR